MRIGRLLARARTLGRSSDRTVDEEAVDRMTTEEMRRELGALYTVATGLEVDVSDGLTPAMKRWAEALAADRGATHAPSAHAGERPRKLSDTT